MIQTYYKHGKNNPQNYFIFYFAFFSPKCCFFSQLSVRFATVDRCSCSKLDLYLILSWHLCGLPHTLKRTTNCYYCNIPDVFKAVCWKSEHKHLLSKYRAVIKRQKTVNKELQMWSDVSKEHYFEKAN